MEQASDDYDDDELDDAIADSTVAEHIADIQDELVVLNRLVDKAHATIALGEEAKLNALRDCLKGSEFDELQQESGRLLIFTEHRDTLNYLRQNLEDWGYTVCEIHGGMNVHQRKEARRDFQYNRQICLATEAAGEGINLQFCRLMINYDLPWNPNRLEQRMGRIHRIGQPSAVYIFNFAAISTVEGRVLEKLLTKLEEIRKAMGDKVFDVIGQLLQLNGINFEEMLKDATYGSEEEGIVKESIERLDPTRLEELQKATGVALATSHVDLEQVQRTKREDYRSEEHRLMPRYVEEFFRRACDYQGVNLDVRADGLWRVSYLKEEFRSPHLEAVRRLGAIEKTYPKLTFYKEKLDTAKHADAEFMSPGHPLFAAIAERLDRHLAETVGYRSALFVDADTLEPYRIHFFTVAVAGQSLRGQEQEVRIRLCAVAQWDEELKLISSDCLHDFANASHLDCPLRSPTVAVQKQVENWLKVNVQFALIKEEREKRQRELSIRREYLDKAMTETIKASQRTQMNLAAKVAKGDESFRIARDKAQNKVRSLQERLQMKRKELDYLKILRPGRVTYLGTALVCPAPVTREGMRNDPEVEAIAMAYVMQYERDRGWTPEDISQLRDGSGFDIRSLGAMDTTTQEQPLRRIEVKGRAQSGQGVSLTRNEWRKAQQLGESYWLYVVWNCRGTELELLTIQNPVGVFANQVQEVQDVTRYLVNGESLAHYCRDNVL
ncbi:helicase-related protein [Spirulina sp. 06S082]|uniref:helicase-related protein n=1 Tax=Spirulina sp. 06S082 TaxID=3110248 RepID=UPI002B204325|nr:helicase-related protein [Spirulina sp. 06S082]MEA5467456.1 helicase-related protein [Spirulina sp. 06S082]